MSGCCVVADIPPLHSINNIKEIKKDPHGSFAARSGIRQRQSPVKTPPQESLVWGIVQCSVGSRVV